MTLIENLQLTIGYYSIRHPPYSFCAAGKKHWNSFLFWGLWVSWNFSITWCQGHQCSHSHFSLSYFLLSQVIFKLFQVIYAHLIVLDVIYFDDIHSVWWHVMMVIFRIFKVFLSPEWNIRASSFLPVCVTLWHKKEKTFEIETSYFACGLN